MNGAVLSHAAIKALAKERGCSVRDLFALAPQNDPFYCGTDTDRADAEWFAALWQRFTFPHGVHLRRIHYVLVSQVSPLAMRNGLPYENTEECWRALGAASKCARYLGLVDPDAFDDRRNPEPIIFVPDSATSASIEVDDGDFRFTWLPAFPEPPRYAFTGPGADQRYHLELWAEKTAVNDVLLPLGRRYGANVVTGAGELSITAVRRLMARAAAGGKPVRIFYVSDFDPAGRSMPVAVARKAEFYIRTEFPRVDLRLFPVVLSEEQVRRYRLPRIPIKESERRKAAFEAANGVGATELDALEALHPGELARLLAAELDRYYDHGLRDRLREAAAAVEDELAAIQEKVHLRHEVDVEDLRAEYETIRQQLADWQVRAKPVWQAIRDDLAAAAPNPDALSFPEANEGDESGDALFDSGRDYPDQLAFYKAFQGKPVNGRCNGGGDEL